MFAVVQKYSVVPFSLQIDDNLQLTKYIMPTDS